MYEKWLNFFFFFFVNRIQCHLVLKEYQKTVLSYKAKGWTSKNDMTEKKKKKTLEEGILQLSSKEWVHILNKVLMPQVEGND